MAGKTSLLDPSRVDLAERRHGAASRPGSHSKKKTWKSHPELALVPSMRQLAVNGQMPYEVPSIPEMFDAFPLFAEDMIERDKSANHAAMNSALGLFHPETREAALASWAVAARLEREKGFELSEPGSRIYKTWSLGARLLALRWAEAEVARTHGTDFDKEELRDYLRDWLRLYWTVEALATIDTPDGPISLRPGARSQGMFDRTKADYALAIALGKPWHWRRKPHPLPDASWAKSDEILVFDALRHEIESSASGIRKTNPGTVWQSVAPEMVDTAPKWPTACEAWYMLTEDGIACWCDTPEAGPENDDIPNSNTPGIAAMGADQGGIWTLPPPSRDHVRQKRVEEKVSVSWWHSPTEKTMPAELRYTQSGAGRRMEIAQALPGGELLYLVKHGRNGLEVIS